MHLYELGPNALIGLLAICATMIYLAYSATKRVERSKLDDTPEKLV